MKSRSRLSALSLLASLAPFSALAVPSGATFDPSQVASLQTSGSTLTVTTSAPRAIINWDDFSIATGETVRFTQPSASGAVLNRVTGALPSSIDGTLSSNGAVYLINPNGIAISSSGVVDTAGFLASTLDLSDDSFLAGGELYLSGDSTASVTNAGTITVNGGNAFLIAQQVANTGTITADGTVGLVAGSEVLVYESTEDGSEQLYVLAGEGALSNQGLISAASVELKAAGGNTFALAINNEGIIRATTLTEEGGRIILRADSGAIANTGELAASGSTDASGYIELSANDIQDTGKTTAGTVWNNLWLPSDYPVETVAGDGGDVPVVVTVEDGGVADSGDSTDPVEFKPGDVVWDFNYFHPVGYNYRGSEGGPIMMNAAGSGSGNSAAFVQSAFLTLTRLKSDLAPINSSHPMDFTPVFSTGASRTEEQELTERAL
jgi:filamentous hemagglutinin family protein